MKRLSLFAVLSLLLAFVAPAIASAANGVTTSSVNMRTGPSTSYQVIATIPANAPVQIFGCVQGGAWCDTAWARERGWVSSAYLSSVWQNAPIIGFNPGAYYDQYYVGRPWYNARPRIYIGPNHKCYRGRFIVACN